jgi:hypothetical protein
MKDDCLRISVEPDYLSALGMAVFAFVRLEWAAVCCERIKPNSVNTPALRFTANVAQVLIDLAATLPPSPGQTELSTAAAEFKDLVSMRNRLLHTQPGTDGNGAQRLSRDGQPWTIDMMNDAADAFTACNDRLVNLLRGYLAGLPRSVPGCWADFGRPHTLGLAVPARDFCRHCLR